MVGSLRAKIVGRYLWVGKNILFYTISVISKVIYSRFTYETLILISELFSSVVVVKYYAIILT